MYKNGIYFSNLLKLMNFGKIEVLKINKIIDYGKFKNIFREKRRFYLKSVLPYLVF